MLSVLRLTSVLKKLQLADIAKYLLLRTSERISVAGTTTATTTTTTSQRFKSSPAAASHIIATSGGISISECCTSSGVSCGTVKGSHPDRKDGHNSTKMSSNGDTVQSSYSNSDQKSTSKSDNMAKACFSTSLGDIVKFLELVGDLKHTKRTGWVLRDIKDVESISGHMYRMSMMTFLLDGTEGLDRTKCMELALVHDLAEALVGDITPFCGISREEKRLREIKAMEDICKLIEPRGKRIMELFVEYEASETPESKFVKDLDRLDMMLQAFEYEKRDDCVMKHQEFFDSTDGKFSHPFVVKLVNEINSQRLALAEKKGVTNGHENPQQQQQNGNDNNDLPQKTASTS